MNVSIVERETKCATLDRVKEEYQNDIWQLHLVGIKALPYTRTKYITFENIFPRWLRQLAKCFIRFQSATKALYTLQQYMNSIIRFSKFLQSYPRPINPENIDRKLILEFISYIHNLQYVNEVKNKIITHIKLVFTLAASEEWSNITKEKIMYREDRLPVIRVRPRYIPNSVLEQLNRHINQLPDDIRRVVMLLQHTGRRLGEICALNFDCLIEDGEGDFFLRYYEFKMKKEESIPISHDIAILLKEQQEFIKKSYPQNELSYLFIAKDLGVMASDTIRRALKDLAKQNAIIGPNGKLWSFQPHQFRHTIGTKMINSGVPAHIVQRYLKHSSPEMTMSYAHLFDSTMKAEFAKFQGKLIDVTGKVLEDKSDNKMPTDLKWLKRNILAQALPNGYCGLPIQQGSCPHANACLTCSHFKTSGQFINQHKQHLEETHRILEVATTNGWSRQIEMNTNIKKNLLSIIGTLEQEV